MTREELEDQIQWEAEQYIPFDVNEVKFTVTAEMAAPVEPAANGEEPA